MENNTNEMEKHLKQKRENPNGRQNVFKKTIIKSKCDF
jgi:hypothetical protein